jgi:hypothetical protein
VPPVGALAIYNWLAFGVPWLSGYAFVDPAGPYAALPAHGLMGVGSPDPSVMLALLIGPTRGLFIAAPWLILAIPGVLLTWRTGRRFEVLIAAGTLALLLVVTAGYPLWHGGAAWGPRYLVPALPLLLPCALPTAARWSRLSVILVAISAAITLAAVATQPMPPPAFKSPFLEYIVPRLIAGEITGNWGYLLGLRGALSLLPLVAAIAGLALWACWPVRRAATVRPTRRTHPASAPAR